MTRNHRLLFLAALAATVLVLVTPTASASATSTAPAAQPVEPADLTGLRAQREVVDTILTERPAAADAPARTQVFIDPHGHKITVGTDIADLDLAPYAAILAAARHYAEIQDVFIEVIRPEQAGTICGAPSALACYLGDSATGEGRMWIPATDPDLTHIVVHEYGHHVDNQLLNVAHLGACSYGSDGSRNWFFARNVLASSLSCNPNTDWDLLLPEVFAEDYAWLNGNRNWVIAGTAAPTAAQVSALDYDFSHPFRPRTTAMTRLVRLGRVAAKPFTIDDWTFFTGNLRSPTRRVDLDLFLFRKGGRKAIARSTRNGSRERIERVLRPGSYEAVVSAYRGSGRAVLRLSLR